jgi:hypothetical protein
MTTRIVVLAALALALLPASATAVYAPRMTVDLDPATAGQPAAFSGTVTQAPGESASRRIVFAFPPGFAASPAAAVQPCPVEAENAGTCPPESRVGELQVRTALAPITGVVHLSTAAQNLRLLVTLRTGIYEQRLAGNVVPRADGGFDIDFDNLPSAPLAAFALKLDGGDRALVRTPRRCGTFALGGSFTSQFGERGTAEAPVEIGGCTALPEITSLRLSRRAFRAVRTPADRERSGYGTVISWRASEAARTVVRADRLVRRRWRRVAGRLITDGRTGRNRLHFDGRMAGKPLRRGSYRVVLTATNDEDHRSRPATARFAVR